MGGRASSSSSGVISTSLKECVPVLKSDRGRNSSERPSLCNERATGSGVAAVGSVKKFAMRWAKDMALEEASFENSEGSERPQVVAVEGANKEHALALNANSGGSSQLFLGPSLEFLMLANTWTRRALTLIVARAPEILVSTHSSLLTFCLLTMYNVTIIVPVSRYG